MNAARQEYYTNRIAELANDQRKLFQMIRSLLPEMKKVQFPSDIDRNVLAESFVRKIESSYADSEVSLTDFKQLTTDDVIFISSLLSIFVFLMHFILSSCGRAALRRSPPRPHLLIFALTKLILFLHTTLPIHTPYISPLPTDYVGGDLETQAIGIPYGNTGQATKVASEAIAFNLSKQHKQLTTDDVSILISKGEKKILHLRPYVNAFNYFTA